MGRRACSSSRVRSATLPWCVLRSKRSRSLTTRCATLTLRRPFAVGEGAEPFVALEGAFLADGLEVVRHLASTDARIPYAAADAFIVGLRGALEASHATVDPTRGGQRCVGRFSPANVLFRDDGQWLLLGLGHNVAAESERAIADPTVPSFHPPELAAGGAPSPMGDYLALLLFMRSVLPYVAMEGDLARLLSGDIRPGDAALIEALQWTERNVFGELAPLRPTMAEAVRVADGVRALLGVTLDPDGFRRFVRAQLVARGRGISLARDASWVRVGEEDPRAVGRAGRGMLLALADQHLRAPGSTLSLWDLIEAGWPGERIAPEAATNRAHVCETPLDASKVALCPGSTRWSMWICALRDAGVASMWHTGVELRLEKVTVPR